MPTELSIGQVLVKIILSGVCASQIHEIDGRKGVDPHLPHGLGHEAVGEVVAVGPGVTKVGFGEKVVLHWRPGSGLQSSPMVFESKIGLINVGPITTFSTFSIVSENRVTRLPSGVALEYAPLFGCAMTTGFGAVVNEAKVKPAESAVIIGFGGVGIAILKSLLLVSSSPITVVDVDKQKTQLALEMGANFALCVSPDEKNLSTRVHEVSGSEPDVVFEVTGQKHLIEQAFLMTHEYGRTLLVGVPDAATPAVISTLPLHLGKVLTGSHGGSSLPDRDIPRIASLLESGKVRLDDFPVKVFPFEQIHKALEEIRKGTLGRVLISMD